MTTLTDVLIDNFSLVFLKGQFKKKKIFSSFSSSNSKPFLFLKFRSKALLKSSFLTLIWNLLLDFIILKWNSLHNFSAISAILAVLKWGFLHLKGVQEENVKTKMSQNLTQKKMVEIFLNIFKKKTDYVDSFIPLNNINSVI